MVEQAYLIALLPLIGAAIILFFGRWLPMRGAIIGILSVAASLILSIDLFLRLQDGSLHVPVEQSWTWFYAGLYRFEWGILLDETSLTMLLVVTIVSLLVQFYSLGYMKNSPRFGLFFAYLSLFTFSMLALVLSNNYLQFFIGWEIMGACSYFLICFEFERDAAGTAANKAFLVTRLGDLGLYVGLLMIFCNLGTLNFIQIDGHVKDGYVNQGLCYIIALLVFSGTVAKSAQFPLHVWLPDAMEGPTPVSALIHAATMVAAGVFLIARSYSFFMASPQSLEIVAWTGGFTAIFAATMAITDNDIKKVLAYSTVSQLGYMVLGMGVMGYSASLFHLTTHAAFKALLFLAAGSVIHAAHTNDMWKMGSLSKQLLVTTITFFGGALALVGFPLTSGFYSKGMILGAAYAGHYQALFVIGCITTCLTGFYMTRLFSLTFLGAPRERDRFAYAHESPWSMTIPLLILVVPALGLGLLLYSSDSVSRLFPWPGLAIAAESRVAEGMAVTSGLFGILVGGIIYLGPLSRPAALASAFRPIHTLLSRKYFIDEFYEWVFVRRTLNLASICYWVDRRMVDGLLVTGPLAIVSRSKRWIDGMIRPAAVVDEMKSSLTVLLARRLQNVMAQNYLIVMTLGFVVLMLWKLF